MSAWSAEFKTNSQKRFISTVELILTSVPVVVVVDGMENDGRVDVVVVVKNVVVVVDGARIFERRVFPDVAGVLVVTALVPTGRKLTEVGVVVDVVGVENERGAADVVTAAVADVVVDAGVPNVNEGGAVVEAVDVGANIIVGTV